MKNLSELDLVYSGYTQNLSNAADRRRFPYFLKTQNKSFSFSWKVKDCDMAYITDASDLSGWCDYKDRRGDDFILVLEFVDMHFHYPSSLSQFSKGAIRFFKGRETRFSFKFTQALKRACRRADAIICASEDQRDILLDYNDNVHITLDRFEASKTLPKSDFSASKPFQIGWEGQPYTLNGVNVIADALNHFGEAIQLNIITDRTMNKFGSKITKSSLTQIPNVKCSVKIKEWTIETFQENIGKCDAMVLPLDHNNFSQWAKPANRMLSLWHLNMPVLCSSSRAFKDLQDAAGLDYYCRTHEDWIEKLSKIIAASPKERAVIANAGRTYAQKHYNDTALMKRWKDALKTCNIASN